MKPAQEKYIPFVPIHMDHRTWPDRQITKAPIWCSVDLRDGNQSLIVPMDLEEKLEFFQTQVQLFMLFLQLPVHFLYFLLLCQFLHLIPVSGPGNDHSHSTGDHYIDQAAKPDIVISGHRKKQHRQPINAETIKRHNLNNNCRPHNAGNNH